MPALCLMLSKTYYVQNYAGIINRPGPIIVNVILHTISIILNFISILAIL